MKNFFFFSLLLFATSELSSQNNEVAGNKVQSKAAVQTIRQNSFNSGNVMVVSQPVASEYFDYDEKIKMFMIKEVIPVNFPKAAGIATKQEYITVVNKWLGENRGLVKPENQNKSLND